MTTKYLEKVKTNESIPGLYPFTEQAIDFICEYRGGLPRDMLVDLHDILDEAVEQCVKIIDVDFVKKYYEVQEKEREKRPVPSKGTAEEKVKKPRIEVKFEDITKTE
jgi:hypothetical protein